jgi:hypothetical protein
MVCHARAYAKEKLSRESRMKRGMKQELKGRDMEGEEEPRNCAATAGSLAMDRASAVSATSSCSVSSC